jgi:signal peptidase II
MKSLLIISAALIIFDQITKHLARLFFAGKCFQIIPGVLSIEPFHNTYLGWLGWWAGSVDVASPLYLHFFVYLFYVCVVVVGYRYFCFITQKNRQLLDGFCVMAIAGSGSALIDNLFFSGSWDFIYIFIAFIIDFKDIYIFANLASLYAFGILLVPQYFKLNKEQRKRLSFVVWLKGQKEIYQPSSIP